ncbi:hypothetical protein Pcryo_0928 [Psychrobacter cryohalolentis K5]|uniref:Uncharacterized protein n=2 Tax=Psychrobacter cryohalolentis TaxID=330922 RepID=Q1QC94_PSYCK|nr:hypothetical protein Pcryo_0928 [Psychrobacter cryohalolentis K5]ASE27321.1 hypothetical protein CEP87_12280 [Psychrobacter cryohalolentis]
MRLDRVSGAPLDKIYSFSDLPTMHTFDAAGINVDHLLLLQYTLSNNFVVGAEFAIANLYDDVFLKIESLYAEAAGFGGDGLAVIRYLETTDIVQVSEELSKTVVNDYFNYCVDVNDRYQPKIFINMKEQLNIFLKNLSFIQKLHSNSYFYNASKKTILDESGLEDGLELSDDIEADIERSAHESYIEALNAINKDVCVYIILWLHAYRFSQARIECSKNKENIAFSHRYYGWSQPLYSLNEDFQIEFKTNFGYGYSSYFYLVMYYKGIQIFNFLDWVNYGIADLSQMHKYSIKYTEEPTDDEKELGQTNNKNQTISNELWVEAVEDAKEACNLYLREEDAFIRKHIIDNLGGMVSRLEKIIDTSDAEINSKYRSSAYKFSSYCFSKEEIIKVKSMNVKGYMISGVLGFINQILKLEEVISVKSYLERIWSLNRKLKPMLELESIRNKDMKARIESEVKNTKDRMIVVWTVGDGSGCLRDLTNMKKKSGLSSDVQEVFDRLQKEHDDLSLKNKDIMEDYDNVNKLLRNIDRYTLNIEQYFSKQYFSKQ